MLTSSHAIYTTWWQLWPTCSRLNFNPTGLHVCAITSHICAGFHPSKTLQQNTFLISSFPSQISCSCLAVLKTWTHVALSWLKVIIKSKYAADSCVLVKIFPRTSQECNHWKYIFTVWQGCVSGVLFPTLSVIPYVTAHHHSADVVRRQYYNSFSDKVVKTTASFSPGFTHVNTKNRKISFHAWKKYPKNFLSFSFIHEKHRNFFFFFFLYRPVPDMTKKSPDTFFSSISNISLRIFIYIFSIMKKES